MLWAGLRNGDFPPRFTWLPLTTLNPSRYADQNLLFHLLLVPFTWFGNLRLAAKLAAILFGGAAVFSLYWLVVRYRIRYPLVWLFALLGCSSFFYVRQNMSKAQSISILFIAAGIVLLLERKYRWLAPTAFLYVWAYNLFVMLGVLALIWVAVLWWSDNRLEWRPLLWTGAGMAAGFVINPYFPRNIGLFLENALHKSVQLSIPSGSEWSSIPAWTLLKDAPIACTCMVVGYMALGYAFALKEADPTWLCRSLLFLLFSTFLMVLTIHTNRFIEYWPPFAVLFAAFTLETVWRHVVPSPRHGPVQESQGLERVPAELNGITVSDHGRDGGPWRGLQMPALLLLLAAAFLHNMRGAKIAIGFTPDPEHYHAGAEWLQTHVPAGALVYDVTWGEFPKLFFYDTIHSYVWGLDPMYLGDKHPELLRLVERLPRGEEQDPAAAVRSVLGPMGGSYLFVGDLPAPPSPGWFRHMLKGGGLEKVYEDDECVILKLRDRPGSYGPALGIPQ